jgi:hypothetical protein
MAGENNHFRLRGDLLGMAQHFESVDRVHDQIRQDQIERNPLESFREPACRLKLS